MLYPYKMGKIPACSYMRCQSITDNLRISHSVSICKPLYNLCNGGSFLSNSAINAVQFLFWIISLKENISYFGFLNVLFVFHINLMIFQIKLTVSIVTYIVESLLIDDSINGNSSFSSLTITNDQLTLTSSDWY